MNINVSKSKCLEVFFYLDNQRNLHSFPMATITNYNELGESEAQNHFPEGRGWGEGGEMEYT